MKKKLADEIGKAFVRLCCPHWYWRRESLSRGIIVCNNCGKRKFIEELKDIEVLVEPWQPLPDSCLPRDGRPKEGK